MKSGLDKNKLPGYLMHQIAHKFRVKYDKKLDNYNITCSQIKAMRCLWDKDGIIQNEILNQVDIKPSSLTKLIGILSEKGLVEKRTDEKDARNNLIFLTSKGREIEKETWGIVLDMEQELTEGFSEDEKNTLISFLIRMLNNLEK
ncbi:MarR family winged helix-turn-helix transcriptional regulator [Clostridium brassicae]|uniref:MarR family winged helix-turn-helix transcriptional regulator n=1 Tax=Clostridium brassicae TaxID=2999072 RepID=A0ABT4DF93_9CLOT|nr:MarR family winged helix-turn-helix transcriptional regulator [Clostridium brassicae]MCY6959776.1 MarR family winged helix-turn-helix transcriptional regulator [Clostridium brassicae]